MPGGFTGSELFAIGVMIAAIIALAIFGLDWIARNVGEALDIDFRGEEATDRRVEKTPQEPGGAKSAGSLITQNQGAPHCPDETVSNR